MTQMKKSEKQTISKESKGIPKPIRIIIGTVVSVVVLYIGFLYFDINELRISDYSSSKTSYSKSSRKSSNNSNSISGLYSYKNNEFNVVIEVSTNNYSGSYIWLGESKSFSGIVKDGVLYDENGMNRLGTVNGKSLRIYLINDNVTLKKQSK